MSSTPQGDAGQGVVCLAPAQGWRVGIAGTIGGHLRGVAPAHPCHRSDLPRGSQTG
jgi:hypothetical protein